MAVFLRKLWQVYLVPQPWIFSYFYFYDLWELSRQRILHTTLPPNPPSFRSVHVDPAVLPLAAHSRLLFVLFLCDLVSSRTRSAICVYSSFPCCSDPGARSRIVLLLVHIGSVRPTGQAVSWWLGYSLNVYSLLHHFPPLPQSPQFAIYF